MQKQELLERVAVHKSLYFATSWAHYDKARVGTLRLYPPEWVAKELEYDYILMQSMLFKDIPPWEVIRETLQEFEASFNAAAFPALLTV